MKKYGMRVSTPEGEGKLMADKGRILQDRTVKGMTYYRTAAKYCEVEQIIEKSRFIGYIRPVENREEAEAFISEIRTLHRSATHNVPAYVIGEKSELKWASDDKEPSGTAGAPILHMLEGENITNVVIVVTRYFGGIKLGTGGLARAYGGTARMALDAAGIAEVKEMDLLSFSLDYTYYGKLQNSEKDGLFAIIDAVFEENVKLTLQCDPESSESVKRMLSEMTGGVCSEDKISVKKTLKKVEI